MSLFSSLLAISFLGMLIAWILFLILGQVTVRKLRKNPTVKDRLGLEFISGYDIFNVASALSSPKWLREKLNQSPLSFFSADYKVLYENTNRFDRVLARFFWFLFCFSGISMIFLMVLDLMGVFK